MLSFQFVKMEDLHTNTNLIEKYLNKYIGDTMEVINITTMRLLLNEKGISEKVIQLRYSSYEY